MNKECKVSLFPSIMPIIYYCLHSSILREDLGVICIFFLFFFFFLPKCEGLLLFQQSNQSIWLCTGLFYLKKLWGKKRIIHKMFNLNIN